jgi:hypothetical protein
MSSDDVEAIRYCGWHDAGDAACTGRCSNAALLNELNDRGCQI